MRTFVYAPDVNAYILTSVRPDGSGGKVIDVSDDIISGSVSRRINAVSSADLTLQNPGKKYLQKRYRVYPMDRIVIYLTRIHKPTLAFSGYLDRTPWEQPYPGPVRITASCTLKRLLYTFWDPGLPFVAEWLHQFGWTYDYTTGNMWDKSRSLYNFDISGGLGHMLRAVLHDVGGWPIGYPSDGNKNSVHVMALPSNFLKVTKQLLANDLASDEARLQAIDKIQKTLFTANGVYVGDSAGNNTINGQNLSMVDNTEDSNPIPNAVTRQEYLATIYGERFVGNAPATAERIDAYLAAKASPLAGQGSTLVDAGNKYGFDARLIVAIAGAEQGLISLSAPFNMFGYGRTIPFASWSDSINAVAKDLHDSYFSEGRTTIAEIGSKWAPVGAANDPNNLNANWPGNVGRYYSDLGGDPAADVRFAVQTQESGQYNSQGDIGDVKTSDDNFFTISATHITDQGTTVLNNTFDPSGNSTAVNPRVGCTFRIKGNPYGDDTLLFSAVYDRKIPSGQISIYVPGATGKGTTWAQNWKDKKVQLDTSFGGNPFPSGGATNPDKVVQGTPTGTSGGAYVNPHSQLKGLIPERIDQGVDFAATGGDILAIGNGKVIGIIPDWYRGQPFLWYQLSDGDHAGEYVFVAEGIIPRVLPGDRITAGQVIASYIPGAPTGIETGFATADGSVIDPYNGRPDGTATDGGKRFARFLKSLGSPVQDPGPGSGASTTTGSLLGGTSGGTYGDTGVSLNPEQVTAIAAATQAKVALSFPTIADEVQQLTMTGSLAYSNTVPLFEWVQFICTASGRAFQSLPNGDLIAFYPDYFNWSKESPYFKVSPIETIDLTVDIGDQELATHVITTGETVTLNAGISLSDRLASSVASIEDLPAFTSLVNVSEDFDAAAFLERYGPRPLHEDHPEIKNGLIQYMFAWQTFLSHWAKQFYCNAEFTFLPELIPGGLVELAGHHLCFYVEEVTHTFDRSEGFSTSASLISPSSPSHQENHGLAGLAGPLRTTQTASIKGAR